MRNLKFKLAATMALFAVVLTASAQRSWDTFYPTRTLVWGNTSIIGATSWSNAPADVRIIDGIASVTLFAATNGAGTLTATLCQSKDNTNWTAISNIALATSQALYYTNWYYGGTNLINTNTWLLPGTLTYPTAATAGFGSTYLNPALATNTGAITMPSSGVVFAGFNAGDNARYFNVLWTQTGATATNWVATLLTGYTHGEVNNK